MDQLCGSPTRRLVDYFVEVVAEPAGSDPFAAGLNPQVVWMDGCAGIVLAYAHARVCKQMLLLSRRMRISSAKW